MRVCRNEGRDNKDIAIETVEIYVYQYTSIIPRAGVYNVSHIAKPHALFIELLLQSLQGPAANIVCLVLLCY